MTWLKRGLDQGALRQGWGNAAWSVLQAIGVYACSKGYDALNHGPSVVFLRTPVDQQIPVVKLFVLPYVSLQPLTYLTLIIFLLVSVRIFQSAALSMIIAFLISFVFFIFMQSFVERPAVVGDDLLSGLLRGVYSSDNPYNDFPSLHTSLSTILAIHWMRVDRRVGIATSIWAALIVMSTVFVHQHYLADVVGGLVIAFGVSWVLLRLVADRRGSVPGGAREVAA